MMTAHETDLKELRKIVERIRARALADDADISNVDNELFAAFDAGFSEKSSIDISETIKNFNARRNAAPNPLAGKR